MARRIFLFGSLCSMLAGCGYACSAGESTTTAGSTSSGSDGQGGETSDASDEGLLTNHGAVVSLTIDPPSAVVDIASGAGSRPRINTSPTSRRSTPSRSAATAGSCS